MNNYESKISGELILNDEFLSTYCLKTTSIETCDFKTVFPIVMTDLKESGVILHVAFNRDAFKYWWNKGKNRKAVFYVKYEGLKKVIPEFENFKPNIKN